MTQGAILNCCNDLIGEIPIRVNSQKHVSNPPASSDVLTN